jgi:hypothetical protein
MSLQHAGSAKDAATNAVIALLGTNARLKFHPTGATVAIPGTVLANLALTTTANGGFTAASGATTGTATAGAITSLQTSGAVVIILCQVAASASDINMTNGLVLSTNDTVSCSSLTYTALPA